MKKVYLIAVIIAIIAGFTTYMFASEIEKKTTIKDAEMIDVYVATKDIEANIPITEEMFSEDEALNYFTVKKIIATDATPNVATSKEEIVGLVTIDKIFAGEQINQSRLQPENGADVALSLKLQKGMVAYSFSAASVTSVDGYINEGDTVDVIVAEQNDEGKFVSKVEYSDLKILRVSTRSENSSASSAGTAVKQYSTLTVEVTEKQALKLYDIENNYQFKLILNHKDVA